MQPQSYRFQWLPLIGIFFFLNIGSATAQTADYGDAPHSYDSLGAAASHKVIPTLYIGANNVDSESAPFPSVNADGDNLNGNNDENGVSVLPTIYTLSPTVGVQVNGVYNSSGVPAVLVGWIDFNKDGIFEDSERSQILPIDTAGAASNQYLIWDGLTPAMINAGTTYIRIRLTNDTSNSWFTNPSPNGARNSGEVEDYPATIIPLSAQKAFLLDSLNTDENAANHGSSSIYKFFKKAGVSNIVGGERDTKQTVTGAGLSALTVGGGIMFIGNYFQTNSTTIISYDGPDHTPDTLNPTGLKGIDLSAGSYFAIDYGKDLTTAGDTLTMKIYSDATHWSILRYPLPSTNNNLVRFFFPFADFTVGSGAIGPMNIQSVGAIQFTWNLYQGSDVTISYIGIPEPKRDYGDAPASYEVSALGSASHLRDDNVKIGALIDTNSSALSSIHCDGDNLNALDDEDAVTEIPIISTISTNVDIVVHNNTNFSDTTAALVGWIDFNHDGDFNDPGERSSVTLVPRNILGTTNDTLHWTGLTSAQIVSATTPLRIRFTTDNTVVGAANWFTNPQPNGYRADGEVEDYLAPIYHVDGGDVSGYPRAQAYVNPDENNDGQPDSLGSVWLGQIVDGELTDLANNAATGDDTNNMSDEEGVRNTGTAVVSMPITFFVDANHQGSNNDSAVIGLWIDWDANGSFNDANDFFVTEKIYFTGAPKVTKAYTMTVPAGASVSSYVVRAGIYPLPNSAITYTKNYTFPGIQVNGEWEDYKNNIKLPLNLLSFAAQPAGKTALLNWSLAKGSDLASTTIMRSSDGLSFTRIGTTEAINANISYTFTDETPLEGDNFYRITLNDKSGEQKLSAIKKVSFGKQAQSAIAVGNNGGIKMHLVNGTQDANYEILSGKGQIVARGSISGSSVKEVSGLVPGLYIVSFKDAQGNNIQNITVTVF